MLRPWTKLLPFFIIEYIAKKDCERYDLNGKVYAGPYKGVLIHVDEKEKVK